MIVKENGEREKKIQHPLTAKVNTSACTRQQVREQETFSTKCQIKFFS